MIDISIALALAFASHFWTWALFHRKELAAEGRFRELERDLNATRKALWDAQAEIERLKVDADDFPEADDLFSRVERT